VPPDVPVDVDPVLPLTVGSVGSPVADVQHRLRDAGFFLGTDPDGCYRDGTRAAVEAFQYRRGLRVDGVCGLQTWSVLVESGRRLGDRFLYRRTPMLRGDDVAELQQRLSALGFDTGRVDGIFGDLTAAALRDFQRNADVPIDGIAGASTVRELLRFGSLHDESELVSAVRDRERLRQAPKTLYGRRLAIGHDGGLDVTITALRRMLVHQGALVTTHHHSDGSVVAAEANTAGAEAYIGLRITGEGPGCATAYYAGYRYASPGGRRLAELLQHTLTTQLSLEDSGSRGMSLPVLRETRMPAVICDIGPASIVVEHTPAVVVAVVDALTEWADTVWD